jgi:hypothetical protein
VGRWDWSRDSPDADSVHLLRHRDPHVFRRSPAAALHASYQGLEAFVAIDTGEIVAGVLPRKAARIVKQWALDHQAELMANWERGVSLLPMEMIPGADLDD